MKVTVGMKVGGELDVGIVLAMSRAWCIYGCADGTEIAEPWESISIVVDGPSEVASSVSEVDL